VKHSCREDTTRFSQRSEPQPRSLAIRAIAAREFAMSERAKAVVELLAMRFKSVTTMRESVFANCVKRILFAVHFFELGLDQVESIHRVMRLDAGGG
jgi:hypothetical protein